MTTKARATFPDAPLTREELRAALRGESLSKQIFYFDERYTRTDRVAVEAGDEDEALDLYLDDANRWRLHVTELYEEECTDFDIVRPGDPDYPS